MEVCRGFQYMIGANYNSTIQLCFFSYLNSIDDGGAILIDRFFHSISVKESHFFRCEASNSGGAIYLGCWKCDISILRCCASYCMIQNYKGHFCFLNTSNLIQIDDTSIVCNGGIKKTGTCTSFLYKADTRVTNTNTSRNVAIRYSCLVYENSFVSMTAYSLFVENNSTEYGNIFFYTYIGYSEHSFSNCIVAKNRIERFDFPSGVVKIQSNARVMNTLFEMNSDPFLLPYNQNFRIAFINCSVLYQDIQSINLSIGVFQNTTWNPFPFPQIFQCTNIDFTEETKEKINTKPNIVIIMVLVGILMVSSLVFVLSSKTLRNISDQNILNKTIVAEFG